MKHTVAIMGLGVRGKTHLKAILEKIIDIHGAKLEVKYDKAAAADVKMTMKRDVMEDIVSGRMSFQRAFMSGAMTGMQGNFSLLGGLDKVLDFTH